MEHLGASTASTWGLGSLTCLYDRLDGHEVNRRRILSSWTLHFAVSRLTLNLLGNDLLPFRAKTQRRRHWNYESALSCSSLYYIRQALIWFQRMVVLAKTPTCAHNVLKFCT